MAEISEAVRKVLNAPNVAVVATIGSDGMPQQTVVWYLLDGDEIVMNTAVGRIKEKNLKRDSRLSFCVEDSYRYIAIKGSVTLNYDQPTAHADIERLAQQYNSDASAYKTEERVTIRLKIDKVAGNI